MLFASPASSNRNGQIDGALAGIVRPIEIAAANANEASEVSIALDAVCADAGTVHCTIATSGCCRAQRATTHTDERIHE
jgi:hypothetical protein